MKFLLVEDNGILAEGVRMALEDEGHSVIVCSTGRPAVGLVINHKPDAVILDISLPDIDGVQVAKFIRIDHPKLPIIFASGHDRDQPRISESLDRKTAILRKPYPIAALLETVHRLMTA
ncbi:MAG TPA: response regulator [Thermoanaerobaculia bacterium]|nr:response regulator [Thermoanaerobaculia bacterium]